MPRNPVSIKISKLIKEGYPQKQAVAIALSMKQSKRLGPRGGYKRITIRRTRSRRKSRTRRRFRMITKGARVLFRKNKIYKIYFVTNFTSSIIELKQLGNPQLIVTINRTDIGNTIYNIKKDDGPGPVFVEQIKDGDKVLDISRNQKSKLLPINKLKEYVRQMNIHEREKAKKAAQVIEDLCTGLSSLQPVTSKAEKDAQCRSQKEMEDLCIGLSSLPPITSKKEKEEQVKLLKKIEKILDSYDENSEEYIDEYTDKHDDEIIELEAGMSYDKAVSDLRVLRNVYGRIHHKIIKSFTRKSKKSTRTPKKPSKYKAGNMPSLRHIASRRLRNIDYSDYKDAIWVHKEGYRDLDTYKNRYKETFIMDAIRNRDTRSFNILFDSYADSLEGIEDYLQRVAGGKIKTSKRIRTRLSKYYHELNRQQKREEEEMQRIQEEMLRMQMQINKEERKYKKNKGKK